MNIYTYYHDIKFNSQQELLYLWSESWKIKGFKPHILSEEDAKQHRYYKELNAELNIIYKILKNDNISKYVSACYNRWLAYAVQKDEIFFVSDYDVINLHLEPYIPLCDNLHFMNGLCPCFASGKPEHFEQFATDAIEISKNNIDSIKQKSNVMYHDQEFINCNYELLKNKYIFSNDRSLWSKLKHYPHDLAYAIKNSDVESIRIFLIKNDLGIINNDK